MTFESGSRVMYEAMFDDEPVQRKLRRARRDITLVAVESRPLHPTCSPRSGGRTVRGWRHRRELCLRPREPSAAHARRGNEQCRRRCLSGHLPHSARYGSEHRDRSGNQSREALISQVESAGSKTFPRLAGQSDDHIEALIVLFAGSCSRVRALLQAKWAPPDGDWWVNRTLHPACATRARTCRLRRGMAAP